MDSQRQQRVVELMARMAAGDEAAIVSLYQEFGTTLASVMRRILRDFHVEQIDSAELDGIAVLDAIAARGDQARLLRSALEQVTTPRNRAITLEVKVQQAMGDRSPAVTVAQQFGMQPAAVRQVVKRTLDGVRALAANDERYASLAGLPFLAA